MATDALKEILRKKDVSKYQVAKELGVTWQTLHFWLQGVFLPNKENQERIKKYLDKFR